jgi:hypothetical protein
MAEQAKQALVVEAREVEASLPADVMTRTVEELAPAEALGRAALSGARQLIRIVEQELNPADLKQCRLIGDMSVAALKLRVRVAEGSLQERRTDAILQTLEMIAKERMKTVSEDGNE